MQKIKVALAGFGKGGRIYNSTIISSVEGLEITKILTSSPENIAAANEDFPKAQVVSSYEELLKDPEIDLVVITTPNHLHKQYVEKALHSGKHVVVEKPFTPTSAEADELIQLAKEKELILAVHHNRRWDSDFLTVKKLLQEKKLGSIAEYESHFDRFRTEIKSGWKEEKENPGSGILYDLGSHLIDQALVLFGLPKAIFADIRIQRDGATVPDNFELLLYYSGLKVTLKAGMLVKEKGPTFIIHGTKGSFVKYGDDPQEEKMKQGLKPKDVQDWGKEPEDIWGKLNTVDEETKVPSEEGAYIKFYENIYKAISANEELQVTTEQARDVIKVIETALKSQAEKRRVEFPV